MSQSEVLSFLSAANPEYIADLYAKYQKDPTMVDESWSALFSNFGDEAHQIMAELQGASWRPLEEKLSSVLSTSANTSEEKLSTEKIVAGRDVAAAVMDSLRAFLIIRAYQVRGHWLAQLDPLERMGKKYHPELDPKTYGFKESDYDRKIILGGIVLGRETATLNEIVSHLQKTYCGTIGIEFMHIQDPAQKDWFLTRFADTDNRTKFTVEEKKHFLSRLTSAEGFETFTQKKYTGAKRFGIEGAEAVIPAIEEVITRAAQLGVEESVIGMAHRGRLNVLTNIMGKPFKAMFSEFLGAASKPEDVRGSSDVKYHLGVSSDREFAGKKVHLSLMPNPSHLEFANPVVVGKVRAKQDMRKDAERKNVLALILHGDAAVSGQGIVQETLMMSELRGYRIGGSVHIVINNQIGFTTIPLYSRSGNYCTDIAKMTQAPIFHVNGDDVESVMHVARMAAEFRQEFKKDVFIDIICYRRHGHNESDEPMFTQPLMYKSIKAKKTTQKVYAEKLIAEGSLTKAEADKIYKDWHAYLEIEYQAALDYKPDHADMLEAHWSGIELAPDDDRRGDTAISKAMVKEIIEGITTAPKDFHLNPKIERQLAAKKEMFKKGKGFDWATAEALAYGSLALEGFPVRLSGQDCGRGTFSQRHSVFIDQVTEKRYIPLNNLKKDQAQYDVHDSPLSEAAVLGFEYGYSAADPNTLVIWEGQFGDFVNGAQVIIDQFIASAETKWLRMSGLVMLLPHGFEGQGPEHSSGRLERFLQLSAEDNWQVLNCSTPANYFHALRRQMHRGFRKPLIIMTPKSLLRHKRCVSDLEDFTQGETFHRVIPETAKLKKVKRVVICSGKVYYDLLETREERGIDNVAIIRLEQFYPFPQKSLGDILKKYPDAEIVWCQEEPENQGGWTFVDRRIEQTLISIKHKSKRPVYVGRLKAAAPATGSAKEHVRQQELLVQQALTL